MVDDPFNQGHHKKLVVGEVGNILWNGECYVGVARIIRPVRTMPRAAVNGGGRCSFSNAFSDQPRERTTKTARRPARRPSRT